MEVFLTNNIESKQNMETKNETVVARKESWLSKTIENEDMIEDHLNKLL